MDIDTAIELKHNGIPIPCKYVVRDTARKSMEGKLHWKLRKQRKTGKNQVLPEKMMSGHCAGNLVDGAPAARFVSRLKQGIEGNLCN